MIPTLRTHFLLFSLDVGAISLPIISMLLPMFDSNMTISSLYNTWFYLSWWISRSGLVMVLFLIVLSVILLFSFSSNLQFEFVVVIKFN